MTPKEAYENQEAQDKLLQLGITKMGVGPDDEGRSKLTLAALSDESKVDAEIILQNLGLEPHQYEVLVGEPTKSEKRATLPPEKARVMIDMLKETVAMQKDTIATKDTTIQKLKNANALHEKTIELLRKKLDDREDG